MYVCLYVCVYILVCVCIMCVRVDREMYTHINLCTVTLRLTCCVLSCYTMKRGVNKTDKRLELTPNSIRRGNSALLGRSWSAGG